MFILEFCGHPSRISKILPLLLQSMIKIRRDKRFGKLAEKREKFT